MDARAGSPRSRGKSCSRPGSLRRPLRTSAAASAAPLAERLRPRTLAEVIGQAHLLGPGKPLAIAFQSGQLHSMILWGPPGVGKTTLARLMADAFAADFIALSAVFAGVKDIREAVARAEVTAPAVAGGRSSSSTRCIASTRRSRTPSCPTSKAGC
jgi:predicted ATPase with chaperone activity